MESGNNTNHELEMEMESGGSNGNEGVAASSRWNPTKEQISMLENLYKQGIKTPSAEEIQQITARLRAYGHIEGKNVFYWFQNHKARQRQSPPPPTRRQSRRPSTATTPSPAHRRPNSPSPPRRRSAHQASNLYPLCPPSPPPTLPSETCSLRPTPP